MNTVINNFEDGGGVNMSPPVSMPMGMEESDYQLGGSDMFEEVDNLEPSLLDEDEREETSNTADQKQQWELVAAPATEMPRVTRVLKKTTPGITIIGPTNRPVAVKVVSGPGGARPMISAGSAAGPGPMLVPGPMANLAGASPMISAGPVLAASPTANLAGASPMISAGPMLAAGPTADGPLAPASTSLPPSSSAIQHQLPAPKTIRMSFKGEPHPRSEGQFTNLREVTSQIGKSHTIVKAKDLLILVLEAEENIPAGRYFLHCRYDHEEFDRMPLKPDKATDGDYVLIPHDANDPQLSNVQSGQLFGLCWDVPGGARRHEARIKFTCYTSGACKKTQRLWRMEVAGLGPLADLVRGDPLRIKAMSMVRHSKRTISETDVGQPRPLTKRLKQEFETPPSSPELAALPASPASPGSPAGAGPEDDPAWLRARLQECRAKRDLANQEIDKLTRLLIERHHN